MKTSIAKKLALNLLLLSLLSTTIVGYYSYKKAREALIRRTYEQLISVRTEKENRLHEFFNNKLSDANAIASLINSENYDIQAIQRDDFNNYLSGYLNASRSYQRLFIVIDQDFYYEMQVDGDIKTFESIDEWPYKISPAEIFTRNSFKENQIIEVQPNNKPDEHKILIGTLIQQGKSKAMVFLEISTKAINQIMFEDNPHNGLGQTGETYLVGRDLLMRSNSRFQENAAFSTMVNTTAVNAALSGETGTDKIKDYRGIQVFSSYAQFKTYNLDWAILAEIDVKEAMIPINSVRNNIVFLSILEALMLIAIVVILANMIVAPIIRLKEATDKISDGEYGEIITHERSDEIGGLINAFNKMTVRLKEQSLKLEKERQLRLTSMIDGQELERQRLSREIHDSLGQLILTVKIKLEQALNAPQNMANTILQETSKLISSIVQEVRNISNNLMPAVLQEFGLITAIRNLVSEIEKTTDIVIEISIQAHSKRFNHKTETYIFRIIQEAINNAVKHSEADKIIITFQELNNIIKLSIADNGIGIKNFTNGGNGLINMKERVNLLSGSFSVNQYVDGKGCQIDIEIPKENV